MADGFWNQQQQQQQQQQQPPPLHHQQDFAGMTKRPRTDHNFPSFGMPPSHEMLNHLPRGDDRGGSQFVKDTQSLGSAYDRYLQNSQLSALGAGEASNNFGAGDMAARRGRGLGEFRGLPPMAVPHKLVGLRGTGHDVAPNGRMAFGGQPPIDPMVRPGPGHEVLPLPLDASNTIFVEGLPPDSTKREVAHIFRPFLGYKEVRLVQKESKHRGGDPLILCFVDFMNPACAATALSALQGYKMDEHNSGSHILRLQFARFPGPRSGSGSRGNR